MKKTLSILMLLAAFSIQGKKTLTTSNGNTINVEGTVENINFEFDEDCNPLGHAVANGLEAHHFDNQCKAAQDKKAKSQADEAKKQADEAKKRETAARKREAASENQKQVKTKTASTKVTTVDHSDHHKVVKDENGQVWHCSPMMQAEHTELTSKADAKRVKADAKVSRANAKKARANAKKAKVVTTQE